MTGLTAVGYEESSFRRLYWTRSRAPRTVSYGLLTFIALLRLALNISDFVAPNGLNTATSQLGLALQVVAACTALAATVVGLCVTRWFRQDIIFVCLTSLCIVTTVTQLLSWSERGVGVSAAGLEAQAYTHFMMFAAVLASGVQTRIAWVVPIFYVFTLIGVDVYLYFQQWTHLPPWICSISSTGLLLFFVAIRAEKAARGQLQQELLATTSTSRGVDENKELQRSAKLQQLPNPNLSIVPVLPGQPSDQPFPFTPTGLTHVVTPVGDPVVGTTQERGAAANLPPGDGVTPIAGSEPQHHRPSASPAQSLNGGEQPPPHAESSGSLSFPSPSSSEGVLEAGISEVASPRVRDSHSSSRARDDSPQTLLLNRLRAAPMPEESPAEPGEPSASGSLKVDTLVALASISSPRGPERVPSAISVQSAEQDPLALEQQPSSSSQSSESLFTFTYSISSAGMHTLVFSEMGCNTDHTGPLPTLCPRCSRPPPMPGMPRGTDAAVMLSERGRRSSRSNTNSSSINGCWKVDQKGVDDLKPWLAAFFISKGRYRDGMGRWGNVEFNGKEFLIAGRHVYRQDDQLILQTRTGLAYCYNRADAKSVEVPGSSRSFAPGDQDPDSRLQDAVLAVRSWEAIASDEDQEEPPPPARSRSVPLHGDASLPPFSSGTTAAQRQRAASKKLCSHAQ